MNSSRIIGNYGVLELDCIGNNLKDLLIPSRNKDRKYIKLTILFN